MDRLSSHEDLAELLGAYAVDAVDADEAELLERHLEVCPRCAAELQDHRETVARLGYMGGSAPMGLWDQIVAAAQEAPPKLRLEAKVLSMEQGRRKRSMRIRTVAVAAGVAAAVFVVLGFQVSRLDSRTNRLNALVTQISPATSMERVRQALATPGSRQVKLASLASPQGRADAVLLPNGTGYVYDAQMQPLTSDRTYQLWGVVGDQRISYGLLGSDPATIVPFRAGPDVQALAVTDEVAGGVEHSSQPLVVVGSVSAPRAGPVAKVIGGA